MSNKLGSLERLTLSIEALTAALQDAIANNVMSESVTVTVKDTPSPDVSEDKQTDLTKAAQDLLDTPNATKEEEPAEPPKVEDVRDVLTRMAKSKKDGCGPIGAGKLVNNYKSAKGKDCRAVSDIKPEDYEAIIKEAEGLLNA